MAEVRRHFILNQLDVNELNRVLAQIADRMDQLEGYRGKGEFKTIPSSEQAAVLSTDLARYGQAVTYTDAKVDGIFGSLIVTISATTIKVYSSDGLTLLHGFGDL